MPAIRTTSTESTLSPYFELLKMMHDHLCPKQVLGVRMGLLAVQLLRLELPVRGKRLFAFVETDGCFVDGVSVVTDCAVGHRTLRVIDYGKVAATFVDVDTDRALRIRPHRATRARALEYALGAPDRWHAQLAAYQIMPDEELFEWMPVELTVDLQVIISQHGHRAVCAECGEDVINEREVRRSGRILCRSCAEGAYFVRREKTQVSAEEQSRYHTFRPLVTIPN
ncbi:MAG: TraR/DksA C4-type zinc finger protein [Chloroflexi bacterium]|nr:TraR/DksA C4-type zinc finger protein [Chloroflexota bacterium]